MNKQHLETESEQEIKTYSRDRTLESEAAEVGVSQLPSEAEVQQAYAQMKAKQPGRRFVGVRDALRYPWIKPKDSDHVLQMEIDDVLTVLRKEVQTRAERKKLFVGIFLSIVLLFVVIAIFTHHTIMFTNVGTYISFLMIGAAASQKQKAAALAISRFDDVRAIGPLAEALEFNDKEVVPMAEKALIILLPRMKASDTALLNAEQRFCLNRALRGKNTELTLAILKAWEQVGDAKAIEEVDKLARGRGGKNPQVVAAAQDCLPFLRQSAERQQIGAQLLRPSDGNLTPSDVLLRPAMPHASTAPSEQLLRPTEIPDNLTL